MEGGLVGVGPGQPVWAFGIGAEDMVISSDVVETQAFHRLGIITNGERVIAEFGLWVNDTILHNGPPLFDQWRLCDTRRLHLLRPCLIGRGLTRKNADN